MKIRQVLFGCASYVPGVYELVAAHTGGTNSARYCYSVWLRHVAMAHRHGLSTYPRVVAELGPGDSLGTGLAALISGCDTYCALDVVRYGSTGRNLAIFDELVALFRAKADIPGPDEFPGIRPLLDDYRFPEFLALGDRRAAALCDDRIGRLRLSLEHLDGAQSAIKYVVPWLGSDTLGPQSVDMIWSQAVLQYVADLPTAYREMYRWLKPGGFMSHQIDFSAHQTSDEWYGHWTYSDLRWAVLRGRKPFWLNREPRSTHIRLLQSCGFDLAREVPMICELPIDRVRLAPRFRHLASEDLATMGTFVLARKRAVGPVVG